MDDDAKHVRGPAMPPPVPTTEGDERCQAWLDGLLRCELPRHDGEHYAEGITWVELRQR